MKQAFRRTAPILFGIAAIVACGSDSTGPNALVGTYTAVQFQTTGSSGQTNQLLAGSSLNLTLAPGGALSGHLHLAATSANPQFDSDMPGTWVQIGNTVKFTQPNVDTFVRNLTFNMVPNGNRWDLEATGTFSGTEIRMTLSQLVPA